MVYHKHMKTGFHSKETIEIKMLQYHNSFDVLCKARRKPLILLLCFGINVDSNAEPHPAPPPLLEVVRLNRKVVGSTKYGINLYFVNMTQGSALAIIEYIRLLVA